MNELLLIDMMSELDPALLENNYIEKDMRRARIPFYNWFLKLKNKSKQSDEFPEANPINADYVMAEEINTEEILNEDSDSSESEPDRGFQIGIFKKKIHKLIKIFSGITATVVVLISIVVILLKRNKSGGKFRTKKIQLNHV